MRRVWAVIYTPSYRPPTTGDELVNDLLPTVPLIAQGNDWYGVNYAGFNESGLYRVVIQAEDYPGLAALPVMVPAGQVRVFIPWLQQ